MTENELLARDLLEEEMEDTRKIIARYESVPFRPSSRSPLVGAIVTWRLAALYKTETDLRVRWAQLVDGAKE